MTLRILSLGAGVQSTTIALMAERGKVAPIEHAIFADTGWEPSAVYRHLDWLETKVSFPVHRVLTGKGTIRDRILAWVDHKRWASIPAFIDTGGMAWRQCTQEYKLEPLRRKTRQLAGIYRKRSPDDVVVEVLIGISTDEAGRMKPSKEAWQRNSWPLIELGMSRQDCLTWLAQNEYPRAPKSSCIGCPYHSDEHWRAIRDEAPEEWADACAIDDALRLRVAPLGDGKIYLHRARIPLREVDLDKRIAGRSRAATISDSDHFNNECEGMCGV